MSPDPNHANPTPTPNQVFFSYNENWPMAQSLFYAVDTGLSIGCLALTLALTLALILALTLALAPARSSV